MTSAATVRIALLLPDLLGTYGDRGNATVLAQRLQLRGQPAEIVEITSDQPIPGSCDLYVVGGGEDVAQLEATRLLKRSAFPVAVQRGAVVLAVCAGLQILGASSTDLTGREHRGLGLLDVTTHPLRRRAVGEVITSPAAAVGLGEEPLTGFENHRGGTTLGPGAAPLAHVVTGVGNGDGGEGVIAGHIVGTYLHGPVLARNPALADHLLTLATGLSLEPLQLDDIGELRRDRLTAGRERQDTRARRLAAALTPRRWLTPGMPAPK
ncbi:MAG: type 1 glutamine amidotransferase [Pseudonocardiaceae bacterium]